MARKTYKVDDLKATVNAFLFNSEDSMKDARDQMSMLLENVLMETGNYDGFRYISRVEMQESKMGATFGIELNCPDLTTEQQFHNTDYTRKQYI